jgi:hypothetical protein
MRHSVYERLLNVVVALREKKLKLSCRNYVFLVIVDGRVIFKLIGGHIC